MFTAAPVHGRSLRVVCRERASYSCESLLRCQSFSEEELSTRNCVHRKCLCENISMRKCPTKLLRHAGNSQGFTHTTLLVRIYASPGDWNLAAYPSAAHPAHDPADRPGTGTQLCHIHASAWHLRDCSWTGTGRLSPSAHSTTSPSPSRRPSPRRSAAV